MSAFDNAVAFFRACEEPLGWDGCRDLVCEAAPFIAQSEPLGDITTVEDYCEWMKGFGTITAPGATYELHSTFFDDSTNTAVFFATYHATHTGEGGPVPPTGRETHSHYVYVLKMGENDKVASMTKIWNAPWAMRDLGWIE